MRPLRQQLRCSDCEYRQWFRLMGLAASRFVPLAQNLLVGLALSTLRYT